MGFFDGYEREEAVKITNGDYRIAIVSVEEKISKNGNEMLAIGLKPNNSKIKIMYYLVKQDSKYKTWKQAVTEFLDCFNLETMDFLEWIGALGAAKLKVDENGYLKVQHLIAPEKAMNLPEWIGELPKAYEFSEVDFDNVDGGELPF